MVKKYSVDLTTEERDQLLQYDRNGRVEDSRAARARILLMAHEGSTDEVIARAIGVGPGTVKRLRKRFFEGRIDAALGIEPPPVSPNRGEATLVPPAAAEPISGPSTGDPPPPVAGAIPPPAPICGTQFTGTVAAGAEQRWFTFNWPATWHVIWTVMPTTVKSGAPVVSWTVGVERAGAEFVTYWLTVKNLTTAQVDFEGRYAILAIA